MDSVFRSLYHLNVKLAKIAILLGCLAAAASACFPPALSEAENSDAGIKARVERALRSHRELDLSHITLDVHLKTVTVSGIVGNWDDQRLITKILHSTQGVEQVVVNVVVPD